VCIANICLWLKTQNDVLKFDLLETQVKWSGDCTNAKARQICNCDRRPISHVQYDPVAAFDAYRAKSSGDTPGVYKEAFKRPCFAIFKNHDGRVFAGITNAISALSADRRQLAKEHLRSPHNECSTPLKAESPTS